MQYKKYKKKSPQIVTGVQLSLVTEGFDYEKDFEVIYTHNTYGKGSYDVEINHLGQIIFSTKLAEKMIEVDEHLHFDNVFNI